MIDFEDHLRNALARQEPSRDFARQVMAGAARLERQKVRRWEPWAAGCIAASLLVGCLGIANFEQRREFERSREARAKVMQALTITSVKLQRIEKKLEGLNQ